MKIDCRRRAQGWRIPEARSAGSRFCRGLENYRNGWPCTAKEDYDLLILDVMLPELNGWQLLQQLRQGARFRYCFTARDGSRTGSRAGAWSRRLFGQAVFLRGTAGPGPYHPAPRPKWY